MTRRRRRKETKRKVVKDWRTVLKQRLRKRRSALEKNFGLSIQKYMSIFEEQGGLCYICQRSPLALRRKKNLAVDHCHKTGRIRGLLCTHCNRSIAEFLRDDPSKARRAAIYLERKTNYGFVP